VSRRSLQAGVLVISLIVLAGCSVPVISPGVDRAGKRKLIGVSLYADDAFTRRVAAGVVAALRGSGYSAIVLDAGFSASRERANIERFMRRKAAAIVDFPVSVEVSTRSAQMAQQARVAVVDGLYPGPGGAGDKFFAAAVDPGSEDAGRRVGDWLVRHVPGGGEVVVVQGLPGQGQSEQLDRGLDSALSGHSRFRVVARGPGGLDGPDAVAMVKAALARHPRARIVVDYGGAMSEAIAAYLRASGRTDVVHVSAGATPETAAALGRAAAEGALQALRDGDEQADPFLRPVPQPTLSR
jgi:ribose transport system substrate-binding protein